MNMRGCGASLSLCPQLYNAGLADDLLAVLRWTEARGLRSVVAGFSLGAGLSLFTLATRAHEIPRGVAGLAAVSPPLDMSRSADELEKPKNVLYHTRFLVSLKRSYRQRQRLDPSRYEEGLENGIDSLRAFDDVVTARYGGYRDAEHYYRSVSAGARLSRIEHRTLILMARDDPFIPPPESLALSVANRVHVQITEGGGHVGFVGAAQAPYRFWAGDRILAFAAYALRKRSGS
jgi:predicted alpha/beta-fold hydrolase